MAWAGRQELRLFERRPRVAESHPRGNAPADSEAVHGGAQLSSRLLLSIALLRSLHEDVVRDEVPGVVDANEE